MAIKKSFSKRVIRNVMILTAVLFVFCVAVASFSAYVILAEESMNSASHLLDATTLELEKVLQSVEATVHGSAWLVEENKEDTTYMYHITQKIVSENKNIVGSAIAFDADHFEGKHFFSPYSYNDPDTGELKTKQLGTVENDYFTLDWYTEPVKYRKAIWSEPYFDEGGGGFTMSTYSLPLTDEEGNIYAVLTADISLKWIADYLSSIKPYPNSNISLISKQGKYLNVDEDNVLMNETIFSTAERADDPRVLDISYAMVNGDKGVAQYKSGKDRAFAVYGPLENGWSAAITCEYDDVLKRCKDLQLILALIALFGLPILYFACKRLLGRITKPLTEMTESAKSIATGNFHTQLPDIKTDDEIRQLRDSFENMQQSLTAYMEDLKTTVSANERMESELDIARKIQLAMLSRNFPSNDQVSLYATLIPAKEVGGDLYDFYQDGDNMYLLVGDVSGKGVPAAIVMGMTLQAFRLLMKREDSVARIVTEMNNGMSEKNPTNMFITLFLAKLNLVTGEMTYCNAGHNPIVVLPPDDEPHFLEQESNLVMGAFEGFPYKEQKATFKRGTRLVLYTDGVTEAENKQKEQFGEGKLLNWMKESIDSCHSTKQACEDLLGSIKAFADGNEQSDDITIMTFKYR